MGTEGDAGGAQPVDERERALVQKQAWLDALMDNTPDHIYFKDRDSRFLLVSLALARSFGLDDASEAVGKTDADFFLQVHAEKARADELRIMDAKIFGPGPMYATTDVNGCGHAERVGGQT